jgi:hypothetical protein
MSVTKTVDSDDVLESAAGRQECFTHPFESYPDLTVEVARVHFSSLVLVAGLPRHVDRCAAGCFYGRRVGALTLARVGFKIFSSCHNALISKKFFAILEFFA